MAHFADSKILKIVGRSEDGYPIHEQPFPSYSEFFAHNISRELLRRQPHLQGLINAAAGAVTRSSHKNPDRA